MPLAREVSDFTAIARSPLHDSVADERPLFDLPLLDHAPGFAKQGNLHAQALATASLAIVCAAMMVIPGTAMVSGVFPAVIENCAGSATYTRPPARAVALNQPATEVMLALGLQDRLGGTAYLGDQILPDFRAAYQRDPRSRGEVSIPRGPVGGPAGLPVCGIPGHFRSQFTALCENRNDHRAMLPVIDSLFAGSDEAARMRPRMHAVAYRETVHLYQRRASCCRWYLLPQGELCASCPLVSDDERVQRNLAWMKTQLERSAPRGGHR